MRSSFDVYHFLGRKCFWWFLRFTVQILLLNVWNPIALQNGDEDKEIKSHYTSQRWIHEYIWVVTFAIHSKQEVTLERLVRKDVIDKAEHSEWASPTVHIVKANGDLRICRDYSVTLMNFSVLEQYPVPTLEELLTKLSAVGKKFTKFDISQAHHQLGLTPESRRYTSINTHLGLIIPLQTPELWSQQCCVYPSTHHWKRSWRPSGLLCPHRWHSSFRRNWWNPSEQP